jgi:hypothetical protein
MFAAIDVGSGPYLAQVQVLTQSLGGVHNVKAQSWCRRTLDRLRLFFLKIDESALFGKREQWQASSYDLEWQSLAMGHVWIIAQGYWASLPEDIYDGVMNAGEMIGLRMTPTSPGDTRLALDTVTGVKLGILTWRELSMLNESLANLAETAH